MATVYCMGEMVCAMMRYGVEWQARSLGPNARKERLTPSESVSSDEQRDYDSEMEMDGLSWHLCGGSGAKNRREGKRQASVRRCRTYMYMWSGLER